MKKTLAMAVATFMLAASLLGCGAAQESTKASASAEKTEAAAASESGEAAESSAQAGEEALPETKELTIYYSNSTEWADPLIQEFSDQTGIKVSLVQDATSSLFARIRAEAANPQGDIVWGGVIDTYRANEDLMQPYSSPEVPSLKPEAVDPNGYYHGFDMGAMVMIYNTDLVAEAEAPTKWADLLEEKYKGQIACADPTSSSSSFACLMAIMQAYGTDDGKGYEFIEKLVDNLDGKVIESSSGVYKGVADGEYMLGLTYEEAALRYITSGAPIQVVYPAEGTSASPTGIGIVKNCKNPRSAQLFVDYLIGKQVQLQLGSLNRRTVRTDVADPDNMQPYETIAFVEMNLDWTSSHVDEFNDKWTEFITR